MHLDAVGVGKVLSMFETTLIDVRAVASLLGASRSTVWRRVADGSLPQPCRIGGMTRWSRAEIEAAITEKLAERDGAPNRMRHG